MRAKQQLTDTRRWHGGVSTFRLLWGMRVVGVLVSAACIYWYAQRRRAALKFVHELPIRTIEFSPPPGWCPDWIRIPEWLRSVDVLEVKVHSPHEWEHVTALNEVRELSCWDSPRERCRLGDKELWSLQSFSNLKDLSIDFSGVTDDGLSALRSCSRLESISIHAPPQITDKGLRALEGLPLRVLTMDRTRITDAGLDYLGAPLEVLSLDGTHITDDGIRRLAGLSVSQLSLSDTQISDEGLAALAKLPLTHLDLCGTQVTFSGMFHLSSIPTLRQVMVNKGAFTDRQITELRNRGIRLLPLSPMAVGPAE